MKFVFVFREIGSLASRVCAQIKISFSWNQD